jgi:hypothetical protein
MISHLPRSIVSSIVSFFFLAAPPVILLSALQRWWRTSPRIGAPAWRSYLAFAAISLGGLSELLWIISSFWARAIGGFHVYDPVLIWLVRFGFLAGPAGLLTSLFGKGTLRWPACGLSAVMTFLWIATGLAV